MVFSEETGGNVHDGMFDNISDLSGWLCGICLFLWQPAFSQLLGDSRFCGFAFDDVYQTVSVLGG